MLRFYDVSIFRDSIRRQHPAVRIERIQLSINPADCIMQIFVTFQDIPPASILPNPASDILPGNPSERGLDPRFSIYKALPKRLHVLSVIITSSGICPARDCSDNQCRRCQNAQTAHAALYFFQIGDRYLRGARL